MSSLSRRDVLKALGISIGGTVLPLSSWATNELGEKIILPDFSNSLQLDKPVTAITCGAGNRGNILISWILLVWLNRLPSAMNVMQKNITSKMKTVLLHGKMYLNDQNSLMPLLSPLLIIFITVPV